MDFGRNTCCYRFCYLNESGLLIAVLASVSLEALAKTRIVVALSTSSALVGVLHRVHELRHRGPVLGGESLESKTGDLGGASIRALKVLNNKEVLATLDGISGEGDIKCDSGPVGRDSHDASIDNLVRKGKKRKVHVVSEIAEGISFIGNIKSDRVGGEGLVEARSEGESKGLSVSISLILASVWSGSAESGSVHVKILAEHNALDLVIIGGKEVVSHVNNIISMRALSLGAVHISVLSVAHATSGLGLVPFVISKLFGVRLEVSRLVVIPDSTVGHVLNVLARTMAGAVIGAGGSLASLAFVTVEALTHTRATIANTLSRALSVVVHLTLGVGSVNPSDVEGANAIRAITAVHGETNSPVIIAVAHIINHASSVATAHVITGGLHRGGSSKKKSNRLEHLIALLLQYKCEKPLPRNVLSKIFPFRFFRS
jgi:hypothetical protein